MPKAKKVIIYSTSMCPLCQEAKGFLKDHKIDFEEKDVNSDKKAREEMIKKTGQFGVPVIEIDGKLIIGFDQEKIKEILGI